jgi:cytochrome c-type biogenesis protein CcmH/NrfG
MITIFVSHSSQDMAEARLLCEQLKGAGYQSLFLDFDPSHGIEAGAQWDQVILQNLTDCRALVLVCSRNSMASRWCFAETVLARVLGKQVFLFEITNDPVFLELQGVQSVQTWKLGWEEGVRRLLRGLQKAGFDPTNDFGWDPAQCPYPGLGSFDEKYAAVYCGREGEIQTLLDQLNRMHTHREPPLAVVIGGSGCGKSSLVRAGVVPRLKKEVPRWVVIPPFRPGSHPFTALSQSLQAAFQQAGRTVDWKDIRRLMLDSPQRSAAPLTELAADLALLRGTKDASVLLVVDQFEELLHGQAREGGGGEETDQFLAALAPVLADKSNHVLGLATLRSDFLDSWLHHPHLQGLRFANMPLGPLPPQRFVDVIRRPAEHSRIQIEDALVDKLVQDTRTNYSLPLLAFTLEKMWKQDHRRFTQEGYDRLGGIHGAIRWVVDHGGFSTLTPEQEAILRRAFLKMARLNEDGQFLRRTVFWDELPEEAHGALERLISDRLLASAGEGTQRTVEVVHESLFEVWDTLKRWLQENRGFLVWRHRLSIEIADWVADGKSSRYLLKSEARLLDARKWRDMAPDPLSEIETEFIDRSLKEGERDEENRRRNLAEHEAAASALLASGRFAEAHQHLGQALVSLRAENKLADLLRAAALEAQHERVGRLELFQRRAREVYARAGEESYDLACEACEDALRALGVFERERWWNELPTVDLSAEQARRLKQEAYRQLILFSGLRLKPGLMRLKPAGQGPVKKRRGRNLAARLQKLPGLVRLLCLIPPSAREWLLQLRLARIPKNAAAVADFRSAHEVLERVRVYERARAVEEGQVFRPSRISRILSGLLAFVVEIAAAPGDPLLRSLTGAPPADAEPDLPNPVDFYFVGLLHFFIGKRRDADLTKFIQLFPRRFPDVDARRPLETAERMLRTAIALESDNFWPYFVLGRTLSAAGDHRGGELAFNSCISLDPSYARGYEQRALALTSQWRAEMNLASRLFNRRRARADELRQRAEDDSRRAVQLAEEKGDPSTYWPLGEKCEGFGQIHEAFDAYSRALELEADIQQMMSRGTNIRHLVDFAGQQLRKRRSRSDQRSLQITADAHALLALVHFIRAEAEEALCCADASLQLVPDHAHALTVRGIVRKERGQVDGARADLEAAVKRDPENFLAALRLAEVVVRQGEGKGAFEICSALLLPDRAGRIAPEWLRCEAQVLCDNLTGPLSAESMSPSASSPSQRSGRLPPDEFDRLLPAERLASR